MPSDRDSDNATGRTDEYHATGGNCTGAICRALVVFLYSPYTFLVLLDRFDSHHSFR